jgi:hypothetical protein
VALKKRTGRETSALHWPCGGVNSMALPTRLSRTWESHPPSPLPVQGLASSLALSAAIGFDCRHDLVHDVARRLWSSYRMRLAPSFLENAYCMQAGRPHEALHLRHEVWHSISTWRIIFLADRRRWHRLRRK